MQRGLQLYFHSLGRRPHPGIIIPRFLHHFVDDGVGVFGIVVKQYQFFCAALHHHVDGFAPVAVSPAAAAGFVLFGQVLRILAEHGRARG